MGGVVLSVDELARVGGCILRSVHHKVPLTPQPSLTHHLALQTEESVSRMWCHPPCLLVYRLYLCTEYIHTRTCVQGLLELPRPLLAELCSPRLFCHWRNSNCCVVVSCAG